MEPEQIAVHIVELERTALERWGQGDPSGYEEISAPEVTYFDPFTETRLDGIASLKTWYDQIRGKIHIERFEILDPHVQISSGSCRTDLPFPKPRQRRLHALERHRGLSADRRGLANHPYALVVPQTEVTVRGVCVLIAL